MAGISNKEKGFELLERKGLKSIVARLQKALKNVKSCAEFVTENGSRFCVFSPIFCVLIKMGNHSVNKTRRFMTTIVKFVIFCENWFMAGSAKKLRCIFALQVGRS